jgi:hypothetical protein
MNQLISAAVGEKLAALLTSEYLSDRAARGSSRAYQTVLSKVGTVSPVKGDELPNKRPKRTSARRKRALRARR